MRERFETKVSPHILAGVNKLSHGVARAREPGERTRADALGDFNERVFIERE
jgi:hypothetical protein